MHVCGMNGTPIPLWRIRPVAVPGDARWQGRRIWPEVIVRAPSAAMARVVASRLDENPGALPVGNETLCFRSGFEDSKLYWVTPVDAAEAAALRQRFAADRSTCGVVSAPSWAA